MPSTPRPTITKTHLRPMVERIITSGSRRTRHQSIRTLYLAILIGVAAIGVLITTSLGGRISLRALAAAGGVVFEVVAIVEVAAICLITPIFMAGAIEQESSPRTWDLLLTTPMSSMGMVLGNLLGRTFFVISLIVAALPILLILQIFGGVSPGTVLISAGIAACTAIVVGSAAVMLSSTRTGGRRAVLAFYAGVIIVMMATWALDAIWRVPISGSISATATTWATPINPFLTLHAVLRPAEYVSSPEMYSVGFTRFWLGHPVIAFATTSGVATVLMLAWSVLRVRMLGPILGRASTSDHSIRAHRPIGRNPIAWRASSGRAASWAERVGRWGWAATGVAAGVVLLALVGGGILPAENARLILAALLIVEVTIIALAAAAVAGTTVTREREQGTLDLVLTTPVQPAAYLHGKLIGVVRSLQPLLLPPLITALATAAVLIASQHTGPFMEMQPSPLPPIPFASWGGLLGLAISIIPFAAFCVAIGLHWSLRSRRSVTAVLVATVLIVVIAGIAGLCAVPIGTGIPIGGALALALCPVTAIMLATNDASMLAPLDMSPTQLQWLLLGSGVLSGIVWSALTHMILKSTTGSFVITMRKLAGT
ncbi:MAG: ABC transporter permease subunit [Phycisphaerales bacterium]|nr:ABC transporter permease subunit [Phycisphaerales bacterium]